MPRSRRSYGYDAYGQPVYQPQGPQQGYDPSSYYGQPAAGSRTATATGYDPYGQPPSRRSRPAGGPSGRRSTYDPYTASSSPIRSSTSSRPSSSSSTPSSRAAGAVGPAGYDYAVPAQPAAPDEASRPATTSLRRAAGRQPRPPALRPRHPAGPAARAKLRPRTGGPGVPHRAVLLRRGARRGLRRRHRLAEVHREPLRAARGGRAAAATGSSRSSSSWPWPPSAASATSGTRASCPASRPRRRRPGAAARRPQKRDVIVVHLHDTKQGGTSTALLVDNDDHQAGHHRPAAQRPRPSPTRTAPPPRSASRSRTTAPTAPGTPSTPCSAPEDPGHLAAGHPLPGEPRRAGRRHHLDTDTDRPGAEEGRGPAGQAGQGPDAERPDGRRLRHLPGPGRGRRPSSSQRFGQVMHGVLKKVSSDPAAPPMTVETLAPDPRPVADRAGPRRLAGASSPSRPRAATTTRRCCRSRRTARSAPEATRPGGQERPRRHGQEHRPGRRRRGWASPTPAADRTPRRRPGSRWSTAATRSSTAAPTAAAAADLAGHLRGRRPARPEGQGGRQDPGAARERGRRRARAPPTPTSPVVLGEDYEPPRADPATGGGADAAPGRPVIRTA